VRLELAPEAAARFREIQTGLRAASAKRARAFVAEVRRIGNVLRRYPRAGTRTDGLRRMILQGFPYSILYEIDGDRVRITSIEHQKQEPDYRADDDVEE
jgi:plasmid stabilization system protein ParE